MEHDPRFARESGRDVFDTPALIVKGVFETPGGVHLVAGYGESHAGATDPANAVLDLARSNDDRFADHGVAFAHCADPDAVVARGGAVAGIGGRSVLVLSVDAAIDCVGALADLSARRLPENASVVVVCLDSVERRTSDPRLIARQAAMPWIEARDCQEVKDLIAVATDLSATIHRPVGLYVAPHLARAWCVVNCKGNHTTTVNARQRTTLHESRDLRQMARRIATNHTADDQSLASVAAEARGRRLVRLEYRAQRGERVPLGFVVAGSLAEVFAEAMESLGLRLRHPTVTLGVTHPIDNAVIAELVAQCERVIVIEAGESLIESHVAMLAGSVEARDGVGTEVVGRVFPFDLPGIPAGRAIDPSVLIDRIGGLLREKPSLASGVQPVDRDAIERALPDTDTEEPSEPKLSRRSTTWPPGSTLRDLAAVLAQMRRDLLETNYMHRHHRDAATALVVHADDDCAALLNAPPHDALEHGRGEVGAASASSGAIRSLVTNRRLVVMSFRGFERGGLARITDASNAGEPTAFVIVAHDRYATRRDGLPETPGDEAGRGATIERMVRAITARRSKRSLDTIRIDPCEWEPMRRGLEHAVFNEHVTVVIADPFAGAKPTREQRVRLEQAAIHGFAPQATFDHIAADVCENCLECTRRVGCPSLRTVVTERGPKLRIDRSVGVNDGAAARIDVCPAFEKVTVIRTRPPRRHSPRVRRIPLPDLPRPRHADHAVWRCCIAGIEGGGIERATRLLIAAGGRMGYHVRGTGRARSVGVGGAWIDHVVFTRDTDRAGTALIGVGRADLLLAGDSLEAARAIDTPGDSGGTIAASGRTRAVVDSESRPTMAQIAGYDGRDPVTAETRIASHVAATDRVSFPIARACEVLLGNRLLQAQALLGIAFQTGDLPLTLEAIEATLTADAPPGEAGEAKEAFDLGRRIAADPLRVGRLFEPREPSPRRVLRRCAHTLRIWRRSRGVGRRFVQFIEPVLDTMEERGVDDAIQRDTVTRAFDAVVWAGGWSVARKYCRRVLETMKKDSAARRWAATRAVVTNLARAVLIKDEPYVAAMLTNPQKYRRDRIEFRVYPARGDRLVYRRDHKPEPVLLGQGFRFRWRSREWQLRLLARCRWLRWVQPGWSRPQRQFRDWYKKLVDRSAWSTDAEYEAWVALLRLPEKCTGYREVLLPKLERVMAEADEMLAEAEAERAAVVRSDMDREPIDV